MSYVVTVAGGQKVATQQEPGKAALAAHPLLAKGYTVWIRNSEARSEVAECRLRDGELTVTSATTPEPGWVTKARRFLDQL